MATSITVLLFTLFAASIAGLLLWNIRIWRSLATLKEELKYWVEIDCSIEGSDGDIASVAEESINDPLLSSEEKSSIIADLIVASLKGRPEDWEISYKSHGKGCLDRYGLISKKVKIDEIPLKVYHTNQFNTENYRGSTLKTIGVTEKEAQEKIAPVAREVIAERLKAQLGL